MAIDTTPAAYTKAEAKAHDAKLADATTVLHAARARAGIAADAIHRAVGDKERYRGRLGQGEWTMSFAEAAEAAQSVAAGQLDILGSAPAWTLQHAPQRAASALQAHRTAAVAVTAAREIVEQLDEVWRTHGRWSRFFFVPNGHIHRSTSCSSLHITTMIGWLPKLSGETEAEAVAEHGTVLCTKCFPSAPVEWTTMAPKALDPSVCPGTGKYVPDANLRRHSPRGTCPECGQHVSVTSLTRARKHKAKATESAPGDA